jgi:hypothetical protein
MLQVARRVFVNTVFSQDSFIPTRLRRIGAIFLLKIWLIALTRAFKISLYSQLALSGTAFTDLDFFLP